MKIAAAYLRVSTERQDEYSLDSQLKLIRDYAAKNDYIVPEDLVFIDDGISGRSAEKRPEFQRMVGQAKDKACPFEAILVWKYSRFARNQEESIVYKSMLARSGVDVVSISEPLAEGPFGSLIERILEWMDEFYSIRLSAEVKRGMTEKVSRGEPVCHGALGYDLVGRQYVPNNQADVVRRIFSEYAAGKGLVSIARDLGLDGFRTKRGNPPDNRYISYILHNPVYIGKIRWNPKRRAASMRIYDDPDNMIIDGTHEPLISMELWEATQARLAQQAKAGRKYERQDQPVEWMLKGLVRCSACGSTLTYASVSCPSMQCHKYTRGQCKVSHSLSIAKANRLVIEALEQALSSGSFPVAPHLAPARNQGLDYERLIKQEYTKLRRVQEAYEAGIDTLEEYAQKKKKLLEKIKELESRASEAPAPEVDMDAFRKKVVDVLELLRSDTATEAAKNEALKSIITHIVYEKARSRLAIYFYY